MVCTYNKGMRFILGRVPFLSGHETRKTITCYPICRDCKSLALANGIVWREDGVATVQKHRITPSAVLTLGWMNYCTLAESCVLGSVNLLIDLSTAVRK